MRDKIFKISFSKYISYLKLFTPQSGKRYHYKWGSISQDDVRLERELYYVYIPKWIPCGYVFFRLIFLRIIDMKYAIIIKNNEKPKAETIEAPPKPGLAYWRICDSRHQSSKDKA
jgi:hypothetical protein